MSEHERGYGGGHKYEGLSEADKEQIKKNIEKHHELEPAKAEANRDSIDEIREKLERAQEKQESPKLHKHETSHSETAHYSSTGFKSHAANQTIRRVQKQLNKPERAFSKVIHQPALETASELAGATVARPSGLLAGGLMSVLSSLVILYICRHYGYEYNFMVGLAGLAGGFALGLLLEGILKIFRRR